MPKPRTRALAVLFILLALQFSATAQTPRRSPARAPLRLVVQQGLRFMSEGFVAFSADGRLVATGGGGDVVVWDVASGREVRRLTGNEGDPGAQDVDGWLWGAFSPDGRLLAASVGPNLRLWNLETGRLLWRGENAANAFFEVDGERPPVSFSADGRKVFVEGTTDRLTWDARTGRLVSRVRQRRAKDSYDVKPTRTAVSPGGRFVASADTGVVTVREESSGRDAGRVRFAEGEGEGDDGLLALAVSHDGRLLVTAQRVGDDGHSINVWDVSAGSVVGTLEGAQGDDASLRFDAAGGLLGVTSQGPTLRALDLTSGRAVEWQVEGGRDVDSFGVSPDGRFVATAAGRVGQVWDARTGTQLARVDAKAEGDDSSWGFAGFTPDETVTFHRDSAHRATETVTLSTRDWKERPLPVVSDLPLASGDEREFTMSRDTRAAAWELVEDGGAGASAQKVRVWRAGEANAFRTFKVDSDEAYTDPSHLALSPDGQRVLVATSNNGGDLPQTKIKVWDAETRRALYTLRAPGFRSYTLAWSPDGRLLATGAGGGPGERASLWDAATGRLLRKLEGPQDDVVEFSPDSRFLLTRGADGFRRVYDAATGREVCRLITLAGGDWVVVDPAGRFDTNNLDELRGVHWLAPEDPLRPRPLEIFMRDYYEPRLLQRLLAGEAMRPVRALADVDRAQPSVRITSVEQEASRPERVRVTVEAEAGRASGGVYDLRLFRDGQLVGQSPAEGGALKVDAQTGRASVTFEGVRLPRRGGDGPVEFSAYAFNGDRVKSQTARREFRPAVAPAAVAGRAYLVTVGVNAYDEPAWNLRYAVNDARQMRRVVEPLLARLVESGEYEEVVAVPLLSADEEEGGRQVSVRDATKRKVRAVFDLLAGREVGEELRRSIPNASRLREATPEDLVIVSFSSHGYADAEGVFYLLPSDVGAGADRTVTRELLGRAVSSDELGLWLRGVDAGELVLVVDACHAAAAVEGREFKPGPMGARGLGQLAYDKGMRVLTATQAADAALESGALGQGLLSYALVRDGLERGAADFSARDGRVLLGEWLEFGRARVPELYELVRAGRLKTVGGRDLLLGPARRAGAQQPQLFDFARRRRRGDVTLARP